MSFQTANAILRGKFLIQPEFAKASLPLVLDLIQKNARETRQVTGDISAEAQAPKRTRISGAQADVFTMYPWQSTDRLPYGAVAMVNITGPIFKYGGMCSYGSIDYNDLLIRLGNSDRVQGIILNIDSPGGQVDGTGMCYETIRSILPVKPVLSVIQDGIAASAGYWFAAGAQEIYVTRVTDQVGSIGAYCTLYDFAGWFEQNGVKIHEIYAPQSIDKNKDYKDALAGDPAAIEADLKVIVTDFINCVKKSRAGRLKQEGNEPFTGKMYFPGEAKALGLIDGVKPLAGVISRMNELIKLKNK